MKKHLLTPLLYVLLFSSSSAFAQRYLSEIFSNVNVQSNITYANNYSILTGTLIAVDLKMDVYTPAGDVVTNRPLIIMIHTGSFGPAVLNQQPTGSMRDSAVVEMCSEFARRGYVVASMDYRAGWTATAPGPSGLDIRTGTLLQAVYRSILDTKACVRFFKNDFSVNSNSYGIDTSKIILGGMGTGGYIALAYATLNDTMQFNITKFISGVTDTTHYLEAGHSYINTTLWGDLDGYGGAAGKNNPNNTPGYSSKIAFVFNCGGALGDSTWLETGNVPMVCFHVVSDPFAPYVEGTVVVPTTGDPVVEVIGSYKIIRMADSLGNNDCFINAGFNDPYTQAANAINDGYDGLFPFLLPGPQAGPWEWFDSTSTVQVAIAFGLGQVAGTQIYQNALLTNPDMSKAKALAYIDTIQNYVNPRMVYCLQLGIGIEEIEFAKNNISVYPNPASERFYISLSGTDAKISSVELQDLEGRVIWKTEKITNSNPEFNRKNTAAGTYILRISTTQGVYSKKINFR